MFCSWAAARVLPHAPFVARSRYFLHSMTSTAAALLFHSSFSLFLLPYFHFLSFPPFFPALRGRATLSSCLRPNNNNAGVVMRPPLKRPCEQSLVILFATQWGGHSTVDPPGISGFSPSRSSQLSRRSGGLGITRGEHGRREGWHLAVAVFFLSPFDVVTLPPKYRWPI